MESSLREIILADGVHPHKEDQRRVNDDVEGAAYWGSLLVPEETHR